MAPEHALLLWLVAGASAASDPFLGWLSALRSPDGLVVLAAGPREIELGPRGFTESGSRRLAVEVDGRDVTLPVFGTLSPAGAAVPAAELASLDLAAGPGAGTGVRATAACRLDVVTRSARLGSGWTLGLGGGERDAARLGLRGAGLLGSVALAGWAEAEQDAGFRASRTASRAQPGQPLEALPLAEEREERLSTGFRLERADGTATPSLVLAAGLGEGHGALRATPFGRAEERRARDLWGRAELAAPLYSIALVHGGRDASDLVLLSTGAPVPLDERRTGLRAALRFAPGRARLTLGAELGRDEATAGGPAPILAGDTRVDRLAASLAGEVDLGRDLAAGATLRWVSSDALPSAFDDRLEPRLFLAWSPDPDHRLTLAWGEGHVEPTLAERHARLALGPPLDLGIFERAFGLDLGFSAVPTVAFGNPGLAPEQVEGLDLDYTATLGRFEVSLAAFQDRHRGLIGDFQAGAGPARPAYQVPPGVPPEIARRFLATLEAFLPEAVRRGLTHDGAGRPLFVLSLENGGAAEVRGVQGRVAARLARGFHGALELAVLELAGLELRSESGQPSGAIVLNAPEKRARLVFGWRGARGGCEIAGRWLDEFEWAAGVFRGPVREATTVDLAGRFALSRGLDLGLTVDNALDERHSETFGGDVWGRQARATVTWTLGGE